MQNKQYVHLASLSASTLPTDLWVPCSDVVKPQGGRQYAVGYFRNFFNDHFETSVELYYKDLFNLIEYADGAVITSYSIHYTKLYDVLDERSPSFSPS